MDKPLLYDVFCGAGGVTRGYQEAGFYVVGIDIVKQPHYIGDEFVQMDALQFLAELLAGKWSEPFAIHASPPCQFGSESTPMAYRGKYPNLIPQTRQILQEIDKPYVIENVENVRKWLQNPVMLCGTMFDLPLWRHRYFEMRPFWFMSPRSCAHIRVPVTINSGGHTHKTWNPVLCTGGGDGMRSNRKTHRPRESVEVIRWAMQIDWMTQDELSQAIPPAYTRHVGERMLEMMGVH